MYLRDATSYLIYFEKILVCALLTSTILMNQRNVKTELKFVAKGLYFERNIFYAYFSQNISNPNISWEQNATPDTDSDYRILSESIRLVSPSFII